MTSSLPIRRAALLGLALGLAGCDVLDLATSSAPILEQTWNLPTTGTSISVGTILPPGVSIYNTPTITPNDSSAFLFDISNFAIARRVGDDCAQCNTLHGTTAFKPAFVLTGGNTQPVPQDVISGAVLGGTLTVTVTNGLSFDPLFVRTAPPPQTQGYMTLVIRSGSLVFGRDSLNGATTAFPAGATLTRTIVLTTGTLTANFTVDITINSPSGDHNEFINANGTVNVAATLKDNAAPPQPTLRVATVTMNVVNRNLASSTGDSLKLDGLEKSITDHVVRGELRMSITNPFGVTGNVNVNFGYAPAQAVTKPVAMPAGVDQERSVLLDQVEINTLLGKRVGLFIGGGVNSSAPITVTPKEIISIANRVILVIQVGS